MAQFPFNSMNRYLGINTESVDSVLVSVCSLSSIDQYQSCLSGFRKHAGKRRTWRARETQGIG